MEKEKNIQDLRVQYGKSTLSLEDLNPNPITQFNQWFSEALESKISDVNAMVLATVNNEGKPSARVVLLKEVTESGIIFYSNYTSRKAKEMEDNKNVSVVFLWKEIERQVRIEGVVSKVSFEKSKNYFQSRPKGSQIGSSISSQSSVIGSREILEQRKLALEEKYKDSEVLPLPENWGGFHIKAQCFEFWQGRENRIHDRFQYKLIDQNWQIDRLSP